MRHGQIYFLLIIKYSVSRNLVRLFLKKLLSFHGTGCPAKLFTLLFSLFLSFHSTSSKTVVCLSTAQSMQLIKLSLFLCQAIIKTKILIQVCEVLKLKTNIFYTSHASY